MRKGVRIKLPILLFYILSSVLFIIPVSSLAKNKPEPIDWCNLEPETEVPSELYDSILYSQVAPRLCEIQKTSDRVSVEVIGQSAGGRNLYLATVTDPFNKKGNVGRIKGAIKICAN